MTDSRISLNPSQSLAGDVLTLYSASKVALISFLFGFPAGLMVASVNWSRMGLGNKIKPHLVAAVVASLALGFVAASPLRPCSTVLGLLFSLAFSFYLYRTTENDIDSFSKRDVYFEDGGWLGGFAFGLLGLVGFYLLAGLTAISSSLIVYFSQPLPGLRP